jgi:hypothetical protein
VRRERKLRRTRNAGKRELPRLLLLLAKVTYHNTRLRELNDLIPYIRLEVPKARDGAGKSQALASVRVLFLVRGPSPPRVKEKSRRISRRVCSRAARQPTLSAEASTCHMHFSSARCPLSAPFFRPDGLKSGLAFFLLRKLGLSREKTRKWCAQMGPCSSLDEPGVLPSIVFQPICTL